MAASQPVNIKLFDGTGFENWLFRVERLLERNSCLSVLSKEKPGNTDEAGQKEWMKEDAKARDLIVQCTADSVLDLIRDQKTAKEMIDSLKAMYVQSGMNTRVQLQRQLRNMSYPGRTSLNDFLVEFDKIVLGINNVGGKIDEKEYISQLLSSMPEDSMQW
uniref:Copia protein n=1 Tax=Lygus hesperus TaxID=30085 RepID=A0A0A9VXU1_LYGHE